MKKMVLPLLAVSMLLPLFMEAQVLKKLKEKVNKEIDRAANAVLGEEATTTTAAPTSTGNAKEDNGKYAKYDFVPGDSILFADDLLAEESGEVPSRWILSTGKAEVYEDNGQWVISARKGTTMRPRMKTETYLPVQFTIEFDMKHINYDPGFGRAVGIYLTEDTAENGGNFKRPIWVYADGEVDFGNSKGEWPYQRFEESNVNTMKNWKHVAIAVNAKGVKVYVNQFRILNAQIEFGSPSALRFEINNDYDAPVLIRNFRIMAGGKSPAKQITTNTTYIARGIQFERASPELLPESMGEINALVAAMKENPSLKFEISGHTSAEKTSSAEANQELSDARAKKVKETMVALGIDEGRITAKGYGQTKPIGTNETPEGRAINRRVEFVKQ